MVAGEGEYEVVLQLTLAVRSAYADTLGQYVFHNTAEMRCDLAVGYAVLDVRFDPVLHVLVHAGAAMDQRDARPAPPKFQGGDGRGVFAAYYQDIEVEIGVGLGVVVHDLGQLLPGNAHVVRQIVETGGHHDLTRGVFVLPRIAVTCLHAESSVITSDG